MAGEIATHLLRDDHAAAVEAASWYANVFKDRYYLEVQAHDSAGQRDLNARVFGLAKELGLPVVATNDSHFLKRQDHDAHDVLLCIGLGKDRNDQARMHYDRGLYFKSAPEIRQFFGDRTDVLENTLKIADEVDVQFSKTYHVPAFPLPEGVRLVILVVQGCQQALRNLPDQPNRFDVGFEFGRLDEYSPADFFAERAPQLRLGDRVGIRRAGGQHKPTLVVVRTIVEEVQSRITHGGHCGHGKSFRFGGGALESRTGPLPGLVRESGNSQVVTKLGTAACVTARWDG